MKSLKVIFLIASVCLPGVLVNCGQQSPESEQNKSEPEIPFERMTAAQHLAKAKAILTTDDPTSLTPDQTNEATRHVTAIPESAPEAVEAMAFEKETVEAAKAKLLEKVRRKYTNYLEAMFRDQGFDMVVTELNDQLVLANDILNDEANRVSVLATIRKDSQGLCDVGFRRVALGGKGVFAGTHISSLGCKIRK